MLLLKILFWCYQIRFKKANKISNSIYQWNVAHKSCIRFVILRIKIEKIALFELLELNLIYLQELRPEVIGNMESWLFILNCTGCNKNVGLAIRFRILLVIIRRRKKYTYQFQLYLTNRITPFCIFHKIRYLLSFV